MRKDLSSLSPLPEWAQWLGASELLDRFVWSSTTSPRT